MRLQENVMALDGVFHLGIRFILEQRLRGTMVRASGAVIR
jgi:hypothetical protein